MLSLLHCQVSVTFRIVTSIKVDNLHKWGHKNNNFMFCEEPTLLNLLGITDPGLHIFINRNPTRYWGGVGKYKQSFQYNILLEFVFQVLTKMSHP